MTGSLFWMVLMDNSPDNQHPAPNSRSTILWVTAIGVIIVAIMATSLLIGNRTSDRFTLMIKTNTNLEYEVVKIHLFLDEIVAGQSKDKTARMKEQFAQVDQCVQSMLEGAEHSNDAITPPIDSMLNSELLIIRGMTEEFQEVALARLSAIDAGQVNSEVHQQFEITFNALLLQTHDLEIVLLEAMAKGRKQIFYIQCVLGLAALGLLVLLGFLIRGFELQKAHDYLKVQGSEDRSLKLTQVMESSLNEIYIFDADNFCFLEVTHTGRDNLGYSMEEMRSLTPLDIIPQMTPEKFHGLLASLQEGKQGIVQFSTEHRRKDGSTYPVDVFLQLIPGRNPSFLAMILDITHRNEAEASLRKSENKLKEAQIIAQMGHWELNIATNELLWSDEIYRIFDLEPQEFEATYEAFLNNIHPEDREAVNSAYTNSLQDKKPYEITHRLLLDDGTIKYVHEKCITEYDENGNPLYSTGTVQDVTERILAEQELHRYHLQLEDMVETRTAELMVANKDLEDFAYSVSHDLKAPLRAISGFSEIISRRHRSSLNEESQRYFDHIMIAGQNMNRLIEDLLKYSRLGRQAVEFQSVDLAQVFEAMERTFGSRIKELGASLNIPDNLPIIRGNMTLLVQIFTNLIDNALSYHQPEVAPVVDILFRVETNKVIVSVNDNGIGIAPEFQEKVFNIFQRLHSDAEKPGTGIGLAIVKKASAMLGGSVELESTVGKGSSFQVVLVSIEQE